MNKTQAIAWLDQEDAQVASYIRKFGTYIQYVGGGSCSAPGCCGGDDPDDEEAPPFAYTIGLFGLGHPELLILGAGMETAGAVLNDLTDRVRAGADLVPGELITFEHWPHRIVPEEVPNAGEIVFGANRHYQRPAYASVPVLQLSYDDPAGLFPWEDGYAASWTQPRPGTFRA